MATPQLFPLPHATRSVVFTALFNLLKNAPSPTGDPWHTFSQQLEHWIEYPSAKQPALFLHRGPQHAEQKHAFGVTKWSWHVTIWIYYRTDGVKTKNTYPDQLTDQFLDGIEQLFQTEPLLDRLTLGGVVYHCWIDGAIVWDFGLLDSQAVIVIPLTILL